MQGYNFTERVRKVLATAREQAVARRHEFLGPEHLLLAIATEGSGVASAVLQNLGVDLGDVVSRIDAIVGTGKAKPHVTGPDLPYTSRAKKALELAMASARDLDHAYVGTEHLLLGLLREEKGIPAQVLTEMGATLERVQAETLRLLGSEVPPVAQRNVHTDIASIAIEIRKTDGTVVTQEFQSVFTAVGFLQRQV